MATVTVHIPGKDPKAFTDDFAKKARKKARKYIREHDLSIKAASVQGEGSTNVVITFPTQTAQVLTVSAELVEEVLEDKDNEEDAEFEATEDDLEIEDIEEDEEDADFFDDEDDSEDEVS